MRMHAGTVRGWLRIGLLGAALGAAGCSTVRMVPPADVEAQSDVFEAKDRSRATGLFADESFDIGPYEVRSVDRDWNKGGETSFGSDGLRYASSTTTTGYSFRFREGAESLAGQCASVTERGGFSIGDFSLRSTEPRLSCRCASGDQAVVLEMAGTKRRPQGTMTLPRGTFEVTSVNESNASLSQMLAGFRVDGATEPVGAVEILHPGRIWLSPMLDDTERHQIACLLTGLMLYVPPDDD